MSPDIAATITQIAKEEGIDPAYALATADRESGGDPTAHASRTIYGLFQMSSPLRQTYGAGDSSDAGIQTRAFAGFTKGLQGDLKARLGRDPTGPETYVAHYFGPGRAARLISGQIPPSTDVRDVFTPQELAGNPEFARAGTVGALMSSIEADIGRREAKFAGQGGYNPVQTAQNSADSRGLPQNSTPDFAAYGEGDGLAHHDAPAANGSSPRGQPIDFAAFGAAMAPPMSLALADDAPATVPAEDNEAEATQPENEAEPATGFAPRMPAYGGAPVGGIAAVPGQQAQTQAPIQSRPVGAGLPQNAALAQVPGTPQQQA